MYTFRVISGQCELKTDDVFVRFFFDKNKFEVIETMYRAELASLNGDHTREKEVSDAIKSALDFAFANGFKK